MQRSNSWPGFAGLFSRRSPIPDQSHRLSSRVGFSNSLFLIHRLSDSWTSSVIAGRRSSVQARLRRALYRRPTAVPLRYADLSPSSLSSSFSFGLIAVFQLLHHRDVWWWTSVPSRWLALPGEPPVSLWGGWTSPPSQAPLLPPPPWAAPVAPSPSSCGRRTSWPAAAPSS